MEQFSQQRLPLAHVHHHSIEDGSPFIAGTSGAVVQPFAAPVEGETVYTKHANSAFVGTSLDADLRENGIDTLIVCGATANHCVETTARMGENLGYKVLYLADAVWSYGNTGPDGRYHSPEDVLSMTLSNMEQEFAQVIDTQTLLNKL